MLDQLQLRWGTKSDMLLAGCTVMKNHYGTDLSVRVEHQPKLTPVQFLPLILVVGALGLATVDCDIPYKHRLVGSISMEL